MIRVMIAPDPRTGEPVLRVEAPLGSAFAALARPMQRRIVEGKLTRALTIAQYQIDNADALAEAVPA